MARQKSPMTAAVRVLKAAGIEFEDCLYTYVEKGGTEAFSRQSGVDEHEVIKTLIMQRDDRQPIIVLMHGDRQVSTKALARQIACKSVESCAPAVADRHSGYQVGGTSPFGTRKAMPVYAESSIRDLKHVYINGGKRGFIIRMRTRDMADVLDPIWVEASQS